MNKNALTQQFAARLQQAMLAAGLHSSRSTSGVCIHRLAEITGYSLQICRRYLRGEALPEPITLVEIAKQLRVTPGWLLFGDETRVDSDNVIIINKNLLHYIFNTAAPLYNAAHKENEIADFLIELSRDVSKINATDEQAKKIIDLALKSVKRFVQ